MGGKLSTGSNAVWAETPLKFIRLMLLAMSSCWYLYALGLFFLLAKLFRQQNGSLLLMAVMLNYAAVSGIIPGRGPASLAQYLIFSRRVFFTAICCCAGVKDAAVTCQSG